MTQQVRQRKTIGSKAEQLLADGSGGTVSAATGAKANTSGKVKLVILVVGLLLLAVGLGLMPSDLDWNMLADMTQSFSMGGNNLQNTFANGDIHAPQYVTVLLPSVVDEKNVGRRLKAITETWGRAARSIYVMNDILNFPAEDGQSSLRIISPTGSGRDNDGTPTTPSSYPQVFLMPANMTENDVNRLKFVIQSIYEHVNPEFAFFGNDHTYVIPEHLCNYLEGLDSTQDLYAGHALQTKEIVFNSGAAGYVLSRATMKKLVDKWNEGTDPYCAPAKQTKFLLKSPGLFFASCLKNALGIYGIDTREDGKYHRFQAFPLIRVVSGELDQWYLDKHTLETANNIGADESYTNVLKGPDCCAQSIVRFHYVEHLECRALYATRTNLLAHPEMSDDELKAFMISVWPNTPKDVGGYSRGLFRPENDDAWKTLLDTVRKITRKETQGVC